MKIKSAFFITIIGLICIIISIVLTIKDYFQYKQPPLNYKIVTDRKYYRFVFPNNTISSFDKLFKQEAINSAWKCYYMINSTFNWSIVTNY
jgi:hypothetical protein